MSKTPDNQICCQTSAPCRVAVPGPFSEIPEKRMAFGNIEVKSLNVQAAMAVLVFIIVGLVGILVTHKNNGNESGRNRMHNRSLQVVATGEEMVELLKENDLWEIDVNEGVAPLLFASYPDNIDTFPITEKKRVFLHGLLPVALTALDEVRTEKERLHHLLAKFPDGYRQLIFSDDYGSWGRVLTSDEIEYILMLARKYRTKSAEEMVKRVELVPLSIIMAQGAIESSWATSRFAKEGNNLFGIWTWSGKGMVPEDRDDGLSHRVAMYDSILDSVRAYVLNLNRLPAYRKFRDIREHSMNSLNLADGLLNYSQRRNIYVWEIKDLIRFNGLRQYDQCFLMN